MKRKHIAIIIMACMVASCIALAGCGSSSNPSPNAASANSSETASADGASAAPSADSPDKNEASAEAAPDSANADETPLSETADKAAEEPAGTAEISSSGNTGDYEVSIDDATVSQDYEGNPAIIVTFSWKNNSDKKTSFMSAFYPKCYQDGVQLETAFLVDGIDSSSYMADVKPGAGNSVQLAYELTGSSDVEVEVEELFSFKDEIIAARTFSVS